MKKKLIGVLLLLLVVAACLGAKTMTVHVVAARSIAAPVVETTSSLWDVIWNYLTQLFGMFF